MYSPYSTNARPNTAGFSMVELLVSIGILVLVLTIVITRQQSFNSSILLRAQTYELAVAIREIQQSAVSAVNAGVGGTADFRSILGVHLQAVPGANQQYTLFIDTGTTPFFFDPSDSLFASTGFFDPRFEIRALRYHGSSVQTKNQVSISFERPNFDAIFTESAAATPVTTGSYQIDVGVVGGTGTTCPADVRTIEVTSTGRVSVLEC